MKRIKSVFICACFFCLFLGCGKFFHYILVDDTSSYTRIAFHEMYEQDNIDVLFVGSSHCYRSFVPEILDSEFGVNTFNVGTSQQLLDDSYFVIREAVKYNDIKHIYLELYFNVAFLESEKRTELTNAYIISDYLKPSFDKYRYLLRVSPKESYINSFFPARRYWEKIFEDEYVRDVIDKKQSEAYKNYAYDYVTHKKEWYAGKGYVANNQVVEEGSFFFRKSWNDISADKISANWCNTLYDIITFCDEKGISLSLVSAPVSGYMLTELQNYDEYVQIVQNMIADTDVEYYDFNLCRENYFPETSSLFKDQDHLNCYGAEKFSYLFADFINGKIPENELFYSSYREKASHLDSTVFGVCYEEDEEENRNCRIVTNCDNSWEYKITLMPQKGETIVLQDFSDNIFFKLPKDEHGKCTITYRQKNPLSEEYMSCISY